MRTTLLLFLFTIACSALVTAQGVVWAKQGVSTGSHEGFDLTAAPNGDVYVGGDMTQTILFDTVSAVDNGFASMFLTKYLPNGDVDWARVISGSSNNALRSIAYGNNAVYVTGSYFQGNNLSILDFGNIQATGGVEASLFLAKISTDGVWQWVRTILTTDTIGPSQRTDLIIAGECVTPSVTIDGTVFPTNPDGGLFFTCYDANGNFKWFRTGDGTIGETELALSPNGVYFGGDIFQFPLMYDGQTLTDVPQLQEQVLIGEISTTGSLAWWKLGGNFDGSVSFGGLDVDPFGDLQVSFSTGQLNGITLGGTQFLTPDATESIFEIDGTGTNVLDQDFAFTGYDNSPFGDLMVEELITDGIGNTYITGEYTSPATFARPTFFGDTIGGDGFIESFIAKYDTAGQYQGVFAFSYDMGIDGEFRATEMIFDPSGDLIVTGFFEDNIDVGPFSLTAGIPSQAFVVKLDPDQAFTTTTGISTVFEQPIAVFPNPFSNALLINATPDQLGGMLEIIDVSGRVLLSERINSTRVTPQTQDMTAGAYLLKITNNGRTSTTRIIKQ